MNPEQKESCNEFSLLIVKKVTGDILAHERRALEFHLAQCPACAMEEREVVATFKKLESLPDPEIPGELYESTRQAILGRLQREKSRSAWFSQIPNPWRVLVPLIAGMALTAVSYGLIHRLIDARVQHYHLLVPLFGLWWVLFTAGSWSVLSGRRGGSFLLNLVSAGSIWITFLTLLIGFFAYDLSSLSWIAVRASYGVARLTQYLFGVDNTFVTAWWLHCCLASFIGTFIFGISRSHRASESVFISSFVVMVLLSPAIYLQGASHNHGLGIIVFGAMGTYVGSAVGMGLGLFICRKLSLQSA